MQRPIKLLLLIPHLGGGGAERVMAQLARHLDPLRFTVHLGVIAQDFPGAGELPATVQVHRLHCKRVRYAGLPLLRLILATRPEVILSGMAHLNFLALLLRPMLPRHTRVLVRQNTTASSAARRAGRFGYRYLYPVADGIICQSRAMVDDLVEQFGISPNKLSTLANPIDTMAIASVSIDSCSLWPRDSWPRLLAIGRLSPEKGVDLLLGAVPRIIQHFPQVHLAILGDGPEADALRKLSNELGLSEAVTLAGHRDDLEKFLATAALFVQPSRYEGMPNALLEAAAAGLPLVSTPSSGGVCDLVRDAPGCWVSDAITSESLADAILHALATLSATDEPKRFRHAFLEPFASQNAVSAYANYLERFARPLKPIHIAMLIPTIDAIGGAERQVILLAKELAARGGRVTIVALSGSGDSSIDELSNASVAYLSLGMRKAWIDPRGWFRYLRWRCESRPDILHSHLPHATWFARWVRLLAPARVQIDTLHTSQAGGITRRFGYRLSGFLNDMVTCVSASVADSAAGAKLVRRGNLRIVPNGVLLPSAESESETGANLDAPSGPFRWVAVGRLSPVKDYPTLLLAFGMLAGEPVLEIAGSGPDEAALCGLAAQLKIESRVHFAGFQNDVSILLRNADAFVLSSRWEGLPVGILEAAAFGLPVVATNGAGTREAMLPGESGLLVPVGDSAALAEAMRGMMAMPEKQRKAMGKRGRQLVEERFSLSSVADQWERLYADLLESHLDPARWG